MDTGKIKYDKECQAFGRNGTMRMSGILISANKSGDVVSLEPLTSKGEIGRARVEIPMDSLDEVIYRLMEIKNKKAQ